MVIAQDSSDPTGVAVDDTDSHREVIRARDRKANAAIQLRESGTDWETIAQVLGFPTGRLALIATEKALEKELRNESKDFLRKMADKRLDALLRSVWKKAINPDHPEQMVAVQRARELIGDHRKLFGLDAPTEIAVYSPSESEIAAWVDAQTQHMLPSLDEDNIFEIDEEDIVEGEVVE